ncbi:MAG: AAA family ATPase [Algoriphagus sp.]
MKSKTVAEVSIHKLLLDQLDGYLKKMLHSTNTQWTGAVIIGKTGAGKTFLIEKYLKNTPFDVLISNQSQQLQNVPYAGLKMALGNYLREKFRAMDSETFEKFSTGLTTILGDDYALLCDYVPELTVLHRPVTSPANSRLPKIENQLYSLFKILFEFISDFSNQVTILFTDDLQWMDGSTANLLQYLLTDLPPSKLLWFGAVRDTKEDLGQVNQLISSLGFDQKHIQRIELDGLNWQQSKLFVEHILQGTCDPQLASQLHELGKGNPALLTSLVEALVQDQLLIEKDGKWVGDQKEIRARYQGVNPTQFLLERFQSLDSSSKKLLQLIACAEIITEKDLQFLSENRSEYPDSLILLISAGILERNGTSYSFAEGSFGEFVYSLLSPEDRSTNHFQLATSLLSAGLEELTNSQKVIIAQHLQASVEHPRSKEELIQATELILEVARFQKYEQAFGQAKSFIKVAHSFIKGLRWDDADEVFFQVYLEGAKIEYLMGEYDLAEVQLDFLIEHLVLENQRAEAFEFKLVINNHLGRYRKALVILKEILLELGVSLPVDETQLGMEIPSLQSAISNDQGNLSLVFGNQNSNNQAAILRLLYVGGMAMHHTSESLMTWAALQLILRSRHFDLQNVSTIGYVSYGRMQIIAGNLDEGVEFGKKGVEVNTSLHDLQYRCRVLGVFAFYIQPWKKAFEESASLLLEGMEVGRKSGDLIGLYILKTHLFNLHFISGKPISGLLSFEFRESYPGMELTYYITHYQKELIRYLTTESPFLSLPKHEPGGLAGTLTLQEEIFYRHYVLARYYFLFGYYGLACQSALIADRNKNLQQGSPLVPANLLTLSFAITQNWQNFNETEKEENKIQLDKIFENLGVWYRYAPVNYASDYWLLRAELGRISGHESNELISAYDSARQAAGTNLYQAALSQELTGKYYLSIGDLKNAKDHMAEAVRFYELWEAKRKARQLIRQYSFLFDSKTRISNPVDIENVLRELGGDMDAELITKKLLTILIRISASSGAAIQLMESSGQLGVNTKMQLLCPPATNYPDSSKVDLSGLFLMALRTKSRFVYEELTSDTGFPEIVQLRQSGVKSCLIFPVGVSESLSMVVYLESRFTEKNYPAEIVRWIRIIASQGGIILENAKIYQKSLLLNEEIKLEVQQNRELVKLIEQQKNAYSLDLLKVQEHERERIAGELHDSLGSQLSTIKIRLANLFEKYDATELTTEGGETLDKLDNAISEVRRIAHHMSPVSLRRFGLAIALKSLIEDINDSTKISADLQILGFEGRLEDQLELTTYRICQELIQNVLKHSQASQLRLQLIHHGDSLNVTLEDNGIGLQKERRLWGMGLLGIEAKVQLLNGTFEIESQPGKGFLAVIDFPV